MTPAKLDYRPVDVRDPETWQQVVALETLTFPDLNEAMLRHILLDSSPETVLMACLDGERIVGINGFIAHPVSLDGTTGIAFQSCITAIDTAYRGHGIFQNLINLGKEYLKAQRDAAFLFAYPNENSGPIARGKLGFHCRDMVSIDCSRHLLATMPSAVFNLNRLADEAGRIEERVQYDARATAAWKAGTPRGAVSGHEDYTNFLFGRRVTKRLAGMPIGLFVVGGFELNKPPIFSRLLARAAAGCPIVRLVVPADSPFALSVRMARVGRKTEPLLDFPLNWPSSELKLEAWSGLKDVF